VRDEPFLASFFTFSEWEDVVDVGAGGVFGGYGRAAGVFFAVGLVEG